LKFEALFSQYNNFIIELLLGEKYSILGLNFALRFLSTEARESNSKKYILFSGERKFASLIANISAPPL
jgi:hypothetical protein